ncbi:MAG: DnaA N-terminal domain-containing protein, partial [Thalassotalea sp.]|nr:DnaA N-terminal domain-containing protein [Thalassotalea sp.]
MEHSLWHSCLSVLEEELPAQQFSMWIRPLQCVVQNNTMTLYAPNRFVLDWVREKYVSRITQLVELQDSNNPVQVRFDVGSKPSQNTQPQSNFVPTPTKSTQPVEAVPNIN